jgi:hypothetical protein
VTAFFSWFSWLYWIIKSFLTLLDLVYWKALKISFSSVFLRKLFQQLDLACLISWRNFALIIQNCFFFSRFYLLFFQDLLAVTSSFLRVFKLSFHHGFDFSEILFFEIVFSAALRMKSLSFLASDSSRDSETSELLN